MLPGPSRSAGNGRKGGKMDRQGMTDRLLRPIHGRYDAEERLVTVFNEKWVGGYHTRRKGLVHNIRDSADYAASVLILEKEEWYQEALQILERVCSLQDTDPESKTYGLWSYYLEEDLKTMLAPDYNWADFISKNLIGALILKEDLIPQPLQKKMKAAVRAAAACSIKRNVAPDYTNMSVMSSMTLISAGELLEDRKIFEEGRKRLRKLCRYTALSGTFSEYNSSAYVLVAMHEIDRMRLFFKDEECREMAEFLNRTAWNMLAEHYNLSLMQLAPPQARAYRNLENGSLAFAIWQGTDGKYGSASGKEEISLEAVCFPPHCPEDIQEKFGRKERWLSEFYYRKNSLRTQDEDTVIIRELDSPDRLAWSFLTERFCLGAFRICDCWAQRRNCMVVWDRKDPKYFRLRALDGQYDFCSAMVYADQYRNRILGQLGLVTDRGSFHYILDQRKDGAYQTSFLGYRFELGDDSNTVSVKRTGNTFLYEGGGLCIRLTIDRWVWDGREGKIHLDRDGRSVLLVGYEGEERLVDTAAFGETWGIFRLEVWDPETEKTPDEGVLITKKEDGMLVSRLCSDGEKGQSGSGRIELTAASPLRPAPYAAAVERAAAAWEETHRKEALIQKLMEQIKGMKNEGAVREVCPISIISMDSWEWPQGVALFALYQYYKASGDQDTLSWLCGWFDARIQEGLPPQNINTTCPMLTLACIYEETGLERYRSILEKWLHGAMKELPRTEEGGLQHVVSGNRNEGQLWDDTLYMTVLFIAKMGRILHDDTCIQESVRQFLVHIKYLTDRKTGLFFHGWTFDGNHNFAEALWGRGNSWYTAGLVDYLDILPEGMEGVKEFLLSTLARQARALAACQDESGLWHTLLDDPSSYLETSASCAFAYGLLKAVRLGYLDASFADIAQKAVGGVLEKIDETGMVHGVSYGTPVFERKEDYKKIEICPMPYGQSMALMMLVEAGRETAGK